jgi:hypothetical protein
MTNVSLGTAWAKYIIPIPNASKLLQEKGMFRYAAGSQGTNGAGYTFWIDELKFEKAEKLKTKINNDINWGRKSKGCQGFGICDVDVSIEIDENKIFGVNNGNGIFTLEFNDIQLTTLKKHFGTSEKITISDDFILSDDVCEKLELKRGYIIKKGEYSIKTLDKGLYTVSF